MPNKTTIEWEMRQLLEDLKAEIGLSALSLPLKLQIERLEEMIGLVQ
jgi:hypothetical protein